MTMITVLNEAGATQVEGEILGHSVFVAPSELEQVVGWVLKPEGLCRDDVCMPVSDRSAIVGDQGVDIAAVALLLGSETVIDHEGAVVAISVPAQKRLDGLVGRRAPEFTLPDLDGSPHSMSDYHGKRRLLVAFATW